MNYKLITITTIITIAACAAAAYVVYSPSLKNDHLKTKTQKKKKSKKSKKSLNKPTSASSNDDENHTLASDSTQESLENLKSPISPTNSDSITPSAAESIPESQKPLDTQQFPLLFPNDDEIPSMAPDQKLELAAQAKEAGNKFFSTKGYNQAIELYSQAIKFSPQAVYFSNRAACHSALKNYEKVIQDCSCALKIDSKYAKALMRRANAHEHLEKFSDALNDYTACCVLEGFKNETSLAQTDRLLKKIAGQMSDEVLKNKEFLMPSETFIRAYMDSFRQTSTGIQKILDLEIVEKDDELVKDVFQLVKEKKWTLAFEKCNSILNENYKFSTVFEALALNLRGSFHFLVGKLEEALNDLEKSNSLDPLNVNTIIKRATLYMETQQVEKAVSIFENAEQVDPENADLFYHRGQIRFLINDLPGSITDYKKSIALDSSSVYTFIQLGVAHYKQGEIEKSLRVFEKALKQFENSHEVYNYYGEVLLDQQKFDKALEYLNKAIDMEPNSPLAYINKAILFLTLKQDTEAAETECRKAVEVDPLSDIALSQLAQLLCHQNKISEAIPFYNQAVKVTRTKNELLNVISCREAAKAQLFVTENYPEELNKLKSANV